jgi:hypothetical protein
LKFWRDRLGDVHLRGSGRITTGSVTDGALFTSPSGSVPPGFRSFPVAIGDVGAGPVGSALLFVGPDGAVRIHNESLPNQKEVVIGEILFRPDA